MAIAAFALRMPDRFVLSTRYKRLRVVLVVCRLRRKPQESDGGIDGLCSEIDLFVIVREGILREGI